MEEKEVVKQLIGLDRNKCYLLLVEEGCLSDAQIDEYMNLFRQAGQEVIIGTVHDTTKIRIVEVEDKSYWLTPRKGQ